MHHIIVIKSQFKTLELDAHLGISSYPKGQSVSVILVWTYEWVNTKWPCGYSQLSVVSDPQNTGKCRPSDPTYRPKMKLRLNLRASAELGPPVGSLKLRLGIFRNTETVDIKGNRVSGRKHKN